jgi:hypothetical protein
MDNTDTTSVALPQGELPAIGDDRTSKTRIIQKRNSLAGYMTHHLHMSPTDRTLQKDTAEKIHRLIGQKPSLNVLLRAGLAAINDLAQQALNEKTKRPGERSKTELELVHMLATTSCLRGNRSSD